MTGGGFLPATSFSYYLASPTVNRNIKNNYITGNNIKKSLSVEFMLLCWRISGFDKMLSFIIDGGHAGILRNGLRNLPKQVCIPKSVMFYLNLLYLI